MSTYALETVAIGALDCQIHLRRHAYGTHAHGIAENEIGDTVASADARQYIDYCHACVIADVISRMLPDECAEQIGDALTRAGHVCLCD